VVGIVAVRRDAFPIANGRANSRRKTCGHMTDDDLGLESSSALSPSMDE
jgi:hypothetical protein